MTNDIWTRDIGQSISDAKTTLSSWDNCMSKAYCKWPVIIGIIVGSLICLTLLWCLFRCCGCLFCCNDCCRSSRRNGNHGYQQAPPTPAPFYNQYRAPIQQPIYSSGALGLRDSGMPHTATFEAPSKSRGDYNEDALLAMPTWDTATTRRVETYEEVEMEKIDDRVTSPMPGQHRAQQAFLPNENHTPRYYGDKYYGDNQTQPEHVGDATIETYHNHAHYQRGALPSPYPTDRTNGPYAEVVGMPSFPPSNPTSSPSHPHTTSDAYTDRLPGNTQRRYEPSVPPSYHTHAPSIASPVQAYQHPSAGDWR